MALQTLSVGGARFRAGSWRGRADLAYLVPLSGAHTLDTDALERARRQLRARGFEAVVTAALAPAERDAFVRDHFVAHEHLHLLRYDLAGLPARARRTAGPAPGGEGAETGPTCSRWTHWPSTISGASTRTGSSTPSRQPR